MLDGEVVRERSDGGGIDEGNGEIGQEFDQGGVFAGAVSECRVSRFVTEVVAVGKRAACGLRQAARCFEEPPRLGILGRVFGGVRPKKPMEPTHGAATRRLPSVPPRQCLSRLHRQRWRRR